MINAIKIQMKGRAAWIDPMKNEDIEKVDFVEKMCYVKVET